MMELKLDTEFLNAEIKGRYDDDDFDLPIPASTVVEYFEPFIRNRVECPIPHRQLAYRVKYNYELWKKELLTGYDNDLSDSIGFEIQEKILDLEKSFTSSFNDYITHKPEFDNELFKKLSLFTALAQNILRAITPAQLTERQKDFLLFKNEIEKLSEALRPFIADENKTTSLIKEAIEIVRDGSPVSALRFSLFSQKDTRIKSRIFLLKFYQFLRSIVVSIDTSKNDWLKDYFEQEGSTKLSNEDLKFIKDGIPKGRSESKEAVREFCYCLNRYLNSNEAQTQFWNFTSKGNKKVSKITINKFICSLLENTSLAREEKTISDNKLIEGYISKYKAEHSL